MLKKVFLLTQFGKEHSWTEKYLEQVQFLGAYGFKWKIFTPNPLKSRGNVEIVPMTIEHFNGLIARHCGVESPNFITSQGFPAKFVSDYYPAHGQIFQDYLHGVDFWGTTNWDVVFGRIDRYVPDDVLRKCDMWSDDANKVNSLFCLYRNDERINNLFRQVPEWRNIFTSPQSFGWDEISFSEMIVKAAAAGEIRLAGPRYFAAHSYDRLIQHRPKPNLYLESDGGLIERFEDPDAKRVGIRHFGREIMYFHFLTSKAYPELAK